MSFDVDTISKFNALSDINDSVDTIDSICAIDSILLLILLVSLKLFADNFFIDISFTGVFY